MNKSVLNTKTISLEHDGHKKVNINGETLTFFFTNSAKLISFRSFNDCITKPIAFILCIRVSRKIKTVNYCVERRHRSATTNSVVDIISKCDEVSNGHCSVRKRKESTTVSDNTMAAEILGDFFLSPSRNVLKYQKIWQKSFKRSRKSFGGRW